MWLYVSVCGETVLVFFLCCMFSHGISVEAHACACIPKKKNYELGDH